MLNARIEELKKKLAGRWRGACPNDDGSVWWKPVVMLCRSVSSQGLSKYSTRVFNPLG